MKKTAIIRHFLVLAHLGHIHHAPLKFGNILELYLSSSKMPRSSLLFFLISFYDEFPSELCLTSLKCQLLLSLDDPVQYSLCAQCCFYFRFPADAEPVRRAWFSPPRSSNISNSHFLTSAHKINIISLNVKRNQIKSAQSLQKAENPLPKLTNTPN